MGKRIKITGYVDIDDISPDLVDLDDPSGLSNEGYDTLMTGQGLDSFQAGKSLHDVETEVVDD